MTCPVCHLIEMHPGPVDVFAIGFVAGAMLTVEGHMPSLCAPHMARLEGVASSNGIDLVRCDSKAEVDELRRKLEMSALHIPTRGAKS